MKDLQNIKEISLYDLAMAYNIDLVKKSSNEYCAPCPICGGTNRFVIDVDKNMWFCRKAENGHRSNGDSIQLVMELEGVGFQEACNKLELGAIGTSTLVKHFTKPSTEQSARASSFDTAYWQSMVDKNAHYMNSYSSQGKYIVNRGISIETAKEFKLGGSYAHGQPAIAIPYYDFNGSLVGGKWRIINPTENKYHVWKGSNIRYSFGWHTHKNSETLILCEGEINAVSIYEADSDIDVLSMGSENSYILPEVAQHLTNYKRLILWADSDKAIERWTKGVSNYTHTFVTVTKDGIKWDANECLRRNKLDTVLHRLLTGTLGERRALTSFMKHELGQ